MSEDVSVRITHRNLLSNTRDVDVFQLHRGADARIHTEGKHIMNCESALCLCARCRYRQTRGTLSAKLRPRPFRLIFRLRIEGAAKEKMTV